MRSAVLLASAMAFGAMASPIDKRYMVTETDLDIETVTVYVTAGFAEPTVAAAPSYGEPPHSHHSEKPKPSSAASSKPAPAPSTPAYTPPPPSSSAPAYTPAPKPSTPAYTPAPKPSSSAVQSSQAPASSAPAYSGSHKSGEIQATFTSGADYQAMVLFHHNAARANHDASPLTWDSACEANAKIAAMKCNFEHYIPEGAGQGQNLFTLSGDSFNVSAGITESWYKGELTAMEPYFGQNEIPENVFHSVGHLTQMVWKKTTKVGCFSYDCGSSMTVNGQQSDMNKYTVCNYASAGNVADQYAANVAAPKSTTNLGSWLD